MRAQAFQQAVGEGVEGDPIAAGVAVELEIFGQNNGVTQVGRGCAHARPCFAAEQQSSAPAAGAAARPATNRLHILC